ncbi:hypothetical protein F5Y10DRAFT_261564 [Nemania abortiva]|nr:hypothetical protein F5Y10DRAFT_261564 [Nemania abortiva]
MRKELNTSKTPFPSEDQSNRLDAQERDISGGGQNAGRSVNIPVVFPICGEKKSHNTVQVSISLDSLPTYGELIRKISIAGEGLLRAFCEEDEGGSAAAIRELDRHISAPDCVYFVWDFAPQIHFAETGCTMPAYGTSDAFYLSSGEFGDCLHAAHSGRISYILLALEFTRGEATESDTESTRSATPTQQPLLLTQEGQITSFQAGAVSRPESTETSNVTRPRARGGCGDTKVDVSSGCISCDRWKKEERKSVKGFSVALLGSWALLLGSWALLLESGPLLLGSCVLLSMLWIMTSGPDH